MSPRSVAIAVVLFAAGQVALAQEVIPPSADLVRLPPVPAESPAPEPLATPVPSVVEQALSESIEHAPASDLELWVPGWQVWEPSFWDPWEGNVELGLSGTEGNSQTFNVRFGMTAKHKTEHLVQSLQITTIQKSANGRTTANTALLDGRIEWPMPNSRWNYFVHGLLEYDEFKPFDMRLSADSGFGYEFIQNDVTTLIGRMGLAISHEINSPDTGVEPEFLLGGEYKHKFNELHSVSFKTEFYPSVRDFSDYRLNSQASWEIALMKSWGLSLKLSVIDRYDSTPQGAKPNDLDYSTLLLWSF